METCGHTNKNILSIDFHLYNPVQTITTITPTIKIKVIYDGLKGEFSKHMQI